MRAKADLCTLALAMAALVGAAGGCRKEKAACTLRQAKEDAARYAALSRPAAGAELPDADRRRQGLVLLSGETWGRREPYTRYYARLLAGDPDELVRAAAARALGKAGDAKYLDNMAAAISDSSAVVRQEAATGLGRVTGPAGLTVLQKAAAEDASEDVRACCAASLGSYAEMSAVKALLRCLDDRAFVVRKTAQAALAKLAGQDYGDDPRGWSDWADRSAAAGRPVRDARKWNPFAWMRKS